MILHTASEGISLARKLETDSAAFYHGLAAKYPQASVTFTALAEENKKHIIQIERAYYGVITDAIEGCFAFNLDTERYTLDTAIQDGLSLSGVIPGAVKMEETIIRFYSEAAEQSKPLMADVPRSFTLIANKRQARLTKLNAIPKI
jgi:rubrerythrin